MKFIEPTSMMKFIFRDFGNFWSQLKIIWILQKFRVKLYSKNLSRLDQIEYETNLYNFLKKYFNLYFIRT